MHNIPLDIASYGAPENLEGALRSDIERRLRKSCSDWAEEDFRKLIDDAVTIAIKYFPDTSVEGTSETA
jgi:hypothetical protein